MTPERLREIAQIIASEMHSVLQTQWDRDCLVAKIEARVVPLIEAARAKGQKDMQARCRQAALKRRDVWLNDLENGRYRTYACCLEEECQDLADIIAALPIDGANQIQSPPAPDREAVARISDKDMRWLLSATDVGAGRSRLRSLLGGTR